MQRRQRKYTALGVVCIAAYVTTNTAYGAGIPFSVIGPREYTLPLNFKPFLEFVQSVETNVDRTSFGSDGNYRDGTSGYTLTTSSKLAYLFQINGLRNVGFEAEAIIPASRITSGPQATTGIGDPVAGLAVWTKPSARTVMGAQDYLILPLGSAGLSSAHTSNIFSIFGDLVIGRWDLDGDIGLIAPLSYTSRQGEPAQRAGNSYFANMRISYQILTFIEPFTGIDWQNTSMSWSVNNGHPVRATEGHEIATLVGLMWHLPKGSLSASWHYGLAGRNAIRTNSVILRWIHAF